MIDYSLDQKLANIEPTGWYDAYSIAELGLTNTRFLDRTNGHLMRDIKGTLHVLGASIINTLNGNQETNRQQAYIDIVSLAIALENPYVFEMYYSNPELFELKSLEGNSIPHVPFDKLSAFVDIPIIRGKIEDDEQQRLLARLPELSLNFLLLSYLSEHRNDPVENLSSRVELPEAVVNLALYKLGFKDLPTREVVAAQAQRHEFLYGQERFYVNDKSRRTIARKYPYKPLYALEDELSLPGSVIEDVAAILDVQRVVPHKRYNPSEISALFSIDFEELKQAMFKGVLDTQYNRQKNDNYPSSPVLSVNGQSLLDYMNDRDTEGNTKRVETRADRYVFDRRRKQSVTLDNMLEGLTYDSDSDVFDSNFLQDWEDPEIYKDVFNPNFSQFKGLASRNPLLPYDEARDLIQRVQKGDMLALNDLVEANYRLLTFMARKFDPRKMDLMDYIQEGVFGLVEAALNFDIDIAKEEVAEETYGKMFSRYAAIWVRKFMFAALDYQGRLIRLPANIINDERQIRQTIDALTFSLDKIPTPEEIASKMGIPESTVNLVLEHAQQVVDSIYRPMYEEIGSTIEDELADPSIPQYDEIEEAIDREMLMQEIRPLFKDREFFVIANHHGLYGPERTLEDIGKELGITRGGASYIELKALRRVRKNPEIMEKLTALFGVQ